MGSVDVLMVRIRNVGVRVGAWRMLMDMAVRPAGHGVVAVVVVPVVVAVRMLVLQGFVAVLMCVSFSQMKQHADYHEQAA